MKWLELQPPKSVLYVNFGSITVVPQKEVLDHGSIGGFLTHSGWNSTLESIVAGVPMICLPYFADQQVNSRFTSEVWKLGLDMKDSCERGVVEKMVTQLMVDRKVEFGRSASRMAELARRSVSSNGSSSRNLDDLVEDIRSMTMRSRSRTPMAME
ncbi:7-deoxyloganetic acid glucosyltransferase [Linum perenne]